MAGATWKELNIAHWDGRTWDEGILLCYIRNKCSISIQVQQAAYEAQQDPEDFCTAAAEKFKACLFIF